MKTFFLIALSCSLGFQALADMDTNLLRLIKDWRWGDPPPARLLKFTDGKIDTHPGCLRVIGSEVGDYIRRIEDLELLAALIFDYNAQSETIRASASRLISLKGVGYVSGLLAERRKTQPRTFERPDLAVLLQLVRSPYVAVKVARIAITDMPPDKAETALQAMRADLEAGASWADAYRKHSELNPDTRGPASNPGGSRTLICYLHDTIISPTGFDIVTYQVVENLPSDHLRELFRAKRGTHILKATDGVYLYHIQSHYDGAQ